MTPPPPGRAAPSAPRARVLSLPARFGLPLRLRLLLVFWVAAASAQGHSRSGPRISAVWKGEHRLHKGVLSGQTGLWELHHSSRKAG
uniref:Sema domain, immunoglobulin domain (Ig), and GPI membrane anchor, (semaphorin) 7A n=1 Tax=Mus musculus TaxID=10090 RepID=A0A1L1SQ43_MOUSE